MPRPVSKDTLVSKDTSLRYFVTAIHPNTRFQVRQGKQVGQNPLEREGDKWVEFKDGVFVTDDPDCIAFCEAHPEIYDLYDPKTPRKMEVDYASLALANREPLIIKPGNPAAEAMQRALAMVAAPGEASDAGGVA